MLGSDNKLGVDFSLAPLYILRVSTLLGLILLMFNYKLATRQCLNVKMSKFSSELNY